MSEVATDPKLAPYKEAVQHFLSRTQAHITLLTSISPELNPSLRPLAERLADGLKEFFGRAVDIPASPSLTSHHLLDQPRTVVVHYDPCGGAFPERNHDPYQYSMRIDLAASGDHVEVTASRNRPGIDSQPEEKATTSATPYNLGQLLDYWFAHVAPDYGPVGNPATTIITPPARVIVSDQMASYDADFAPYDLAMLDFFGALKNRVQAVYEAVTSAQTDTRSPADKFFQAVNEAGSHPEAGQADLFVSYPGVPAPLLHLCGADEPRRTQISFSQNGTYGQEGPVYNAYIEQDAKNGRIYLWEHTSASEGNNFEMTTLASPAELKARLEVWFSKAGGIYAPPAPAPTQAAARQPR